MRAERLEAAHPVLGVSVVRRPATAFGNGGVRSQLPERSSDRDKRIRRCKRETRMETRARAGRSEGRGGRDREADKEGKEEARKTKVTAGSEYLWDKFSLSRPGLSFSRKERKREKSCHPAAAPLSGRRLKKGRDESLGDIPDGVNRIDWWKLILIRSTGIPGNSNNAAGREFACLLC